MNKLKQFKMSSGDEIVCEVVEYNDNDVIAKKVIQIDSQILDEGTRAYVMRPWMLYQDGIEQFTIITKSNILATAIPTDGLIHQYYTTLLQTIETYHDRETHGDITQEELQEIATDLEYNNHHLETYAPYDDDSDSERPKKSNILHLVPTTT